MKQQFFLGLLRAKRDVGREGTLHDKVEKGHRATLKKTQRGDSSQLAVIALPEEEGGHFGCHNGWVLLASGGTESGMLFNIPQCPGWPPPEEPSGPKCQQEEGWEILLQRGRWRGRMESSL